MDIFSLYTQQLQANIRSLPQESIDAVVDELYDAYRRGGKVFIFGNGGSAATAAHFACDLAKGTVVPGMPRFRVITLADNASLLTAWANDTNYERVFAEQLEGLVDNGDVAIAISGSGNSENVLLGVKVAKRAGARIIALTGFDGGKLKDRADLNIVAPCVRIEQAEDLHLIIQHLICISLRERIKSDEVKAR